MVYGTTHGQTEKIVRRMAEVLSAEHFVTVRRGDAEGLHERLDQYDAVVVAASVRFGRYQPYVRRFVRRHVTALNAIPSVFVSVCGAVAGSWSEGEKHARQYVETFLGETGWGPQRRRTFAGALNYTQYGLLTRWMMKLISKRTGRPTDTSRDYDFTDWTAVEAFAREVGAMTIAMSAEPERTVH
jgi:menaquinone-dependent protoporphyrinogen oxidase